MNANQSVLLRTAFEDVYAENRWGKGSGPGSSPKNTIFYRAFLEQFMKVNAVRSVTDLGCGDWQLSRFLDWSGIDYIGLDVVPHLVEANTKAFGARGVEFRVLESVDDLPGGDLLLAKEIFQHLPNAMICDYLEAIRNKYRMALITNGIEPSSYCNVDIAIGDVRPLHMHEAPFSVPGAFVFNHSFVVDGVNYQNGTYLMIGQAA
jgi:SAM-dependent methyltransferase